MQYRVTNKYGWTTLKFLNGLAARRRFATATNNGMNTYEIYTVIIPKKLDATQISARSPSYMINTFRSLTLVKNSLRTIAIYDGVQHALW